MVGDPRFFDRTGPHRAAEIAAACGARVERDAGRALSGVAPLAEAGPEHVSFLDNRRYLPDLRQTRAGAVVLHPDHRDAAPEAATLLLSTEPYLAWARTCALFHPDSSPPPGIHPTALVDPSSVVGAEVSIGAYAVIGPRVELGDGVQVAAHAVIGDGCVLGPGCRIGESASLSYAILGARVIIHPGARIGQPGFGFTQGPTGFVTVPQLGRVLIGDDADIGANTCIDRGSASDTVIGPGTRIDNLVQIGHNVRTGRSCIIVGQAGVSGSAELGNFVQLGAQSGVAGHLKLGDRSRLAAASGVMTDIPAGADYGGTPAEPIRIYMQGVALLRRMVASRRKGDGAAGGAEAAGRAG